MLSLIIIGGGISGLSLAYAVLSNKKGIDVLLVESDRRLGGKVWTQTERGYILESGVNAFLNNKPRTLLLASSLLLSPLTSRDEARRRLIYSDGKLHRLPESPPAFLASSLISLPGKLRILCEPFIPKGSKDDESLADFARRRLGKEAYEKLIDPMASGIYAGDPEVMSLKSCFPRIYELENKYGSLIKALIKLKKEAKSSGKKVGAGPGGVLTSFSSGMSSMINSLSAVLKDIIRTESRAVSMEKTKQGYAVYLEDGSMLETERVVLATPAYEAGNILKDMTKTLSDALKEIPYPPLSIVALGYKKEKIKTSIDAFGFLVPKKEGRKILGTLYDSSIFPGRAPEGYVLLRCMTGGAKSPETAIMDDNRLLSTVMTDLRDISGIRAEPDFIKIFRHEKAIPQYLIGHSERLRKIDEILQRYKGLYLTGNSLRGIGFNDCIENSYKLSERLYPVTS